MLWWERGTSKRVLIFLFFSVDNLRIILIIGGMSRNIDYATTATYRLVPWERSPNSVWMV